MIAFYYNNLFIYTDRKEIDTDFVSLMTTVSGKVANRYRRKQKSGKEQVQIPYHTSTLRAQVKLSLQDKEKDSSKMFFDPYDDKKKSVLVQRAESSPF